MCISTTNGAKGYCMYTCLHADAKSLYFPWLFAKFWSYLGRENEVQDIWQLPPPFVRLGTCLHPTLLNSRTHPTWNKRESTWKRKPCQRPLLESVRQPGARRQIQSWKRRKEATDGADEMWKRNFIQLYFWNFHLGLWWNNTTTDPNTTESISKHTNNIE